MRRAGTSAGAAAEATSGSARPQAEMSSESGWTLVELLVVIALTVIVVGGPMTFIIVSLKQQNVSSSRAVAATQEQAGVQRLTRDLRQALSNTASFSWSGSSASASFQIATPGTGGIGQTETPETITWSCTFGNAGSCTRKVGSGTAVKEIANVVSLAFAPRDSLGTLLGGASSPYSATDATSDPIAYVGITVQVLDISQLDNTSSPSHAVAGVNNAITVTDGVGLRNNAI
jgi:Tfp pilus assembly protein PilW